MQNYDVELRDMTQEDISAVASIHYTALPDDFCSCLGLGFLEKAYYPHFLTLRARIGLVAVHEGRVCGFITAGPAQGYYVELLKKYFGTALKYGILALFRRPLFLFYSVGIILVLFSKRAYQPLSTDFELLYEAVSAESQGKGVGKRLIRAMSERLPEIEGFEQCVVKTLLSTPQTNKFYLDNGFQHLHSGLGRVWFVQKISTSV